MELTMKSLEGLARWCPDTDLTFDLSSGKASPMKRIHAFDDREAPMVNALFRSEVLRTLMRELNLSEGNAFLNTLCRHLGIGASADVSARESPLKCATLRTILNEVKAYAFERAALLDHIASSPMWCKDAALQRMIAQADRSMLRMVQRDCLLAEQRAAVASYRNFVESIVKVPDTERAVTTLLALAASVPERVCLDRDAAREVVICHTEAFCDRAVALIARDATGKGLREGEMVKRVVTALDSMIRQVGLMNVKPPQGDAALRVNLLQKASMWGKVALPDEISETLLEVMRHQIVVGDEKILKCYQCGWHVFGTTSIPYPMDQGERRVIGTAAQTRVFERWLNATYEDSRSRLPETVAAESVMIRALRKNDAARVEVLLDGVPLDTTAPPEEVQDAWMTFMDLAEYPDRQPLILAAMMFGCQTMTERLRTDLSTGMTTVGMAVIPNRDPTYDHTQIALERFGNKVTITIDRTLRSPERAACLTAEVPLSQHHPEAYFRQRARFEVALERGEVCFKVLEPQEYRYNLFAAETC